MSHIGLLMTGVLTTGQPSLPKLPEQPPFQPDNPVQQSTQEHSNEVVPATEMTPPEFIQLNGNLKVAHSPLNLKHQNILSKFAEKIKSIQSKFSYLGKDTAIDGFPLGGISVVAAVNSLVRQELAISSFSDEQSSDELVIGRSRSVSKGESPNLKPNLKPKFINQNLPTLGFGNSGISVKVLQRLLLSNGYAVRVDGVFGALTESAVKAFQNRRNLGVDGVVGFRTWSELTR
jgi:Putative peptidoglycan binding domain